MSDIDTPTAYNDLFAEPAEETIDFNETPEEVTEEVETEQPTETEQELPKEDTTDEAAEEPAAPVVVAKIEIDGKEFEFDEPKIQRLAEQYVELATQNKELEQHREVVQQAMGHIDNIRKGVDIDEAMYALGVDFDKLITDKVKEFIRRSTLSQKERELEDMRQENGKLKAEREAREAREAAER
jgi:hypothetical protein